MSYYAMISEADKRVEALEKRVEELEKRVHELEAVLTQIANTPLNRPCGLQDVKVVAELALGLNTVHRSSFDYEAEGRKE